MNIVILGLSITSSWGNGHATTFRGLVRELTRAGHHVLFLERDVPWYASSRDLPHPDFCRTELYASLPDLQVRFAEPVRTADVVIVGSYVPEGVAVGEWVLRTAHGVKAFYDIDTPVTLAKLARHDYEYLHPRLIPQYDLYLSFTSLLSDWNHGNAHFLRGIVRELQRRGHVVRVYEPAGGWSLQNLLEGYGPAKLDELRTYYPDLQSTFYQLDTLDLDEALGGADLVLVHEWNDHELVRRVGEHRARSTYQLLFHDTHHRAVTERQSMAAYDLTHYDGVLAFGGVIRDLYLRENWARRAWTWHEAADTTVFYPHQPPTELAGDLVWVGNWGDDERTAELHEFLINPVKELGLKAKIYGVRYPESALQALAEAGIEYGGWLPNYQAPEEYQLTSRPDGFMKALITC